MSPYTYNSSNELQTIPGVTYAYDNNGNLQTKTDATGATGYTWDYENRLTQVSMPGTAGTVNYKYDPFGRRVQKVFTQGGNTTTTNYVYDGANVIEELDQFGAAVARYVQGPGIDAPLAMVRGGVVSYYEQDGIGAVTSLSNSAGALANTYSYDSFGKATASSGTITNSFRYTSREFDSETGMYYYRARYYDQSAGRFIKEDVLGFDAGENFYIYAENNPVNLVDPFGYFPRPVKPYRWRWCSGSEVSACKQICRLQGKDFGSCRVSQRYRIGPAGWSAGPDWIDGPLSCSCKGQNECSKATVPNPAAEQELRFLLIGMGAAGGLVLAPEGTLPALPRLIPALAK